MNSKTTESQDQAFIAPRAALTPELKTALNDMRVALMGRPHALNNYAVLCAGMEEPGSDRIALALLLWFESQFFALTADEIKAATLRLIVESNYAPDIKDIKETCFAVAIEKRFGGAKTLFSEASRKATYLSTGASLAWTAPEAFLVKQIGARRIAQSSLQDIQHEVYAALGDFIAKGQPDLSSEAPFTNSKNDIEQYARAPRAKRDLSPLLSKLKTTK